MTLLEAQARLLVVAATIRTVLPELRRIEDEVLIGLPPGWEEELERDEPIRPEASISGCAGLMAAMLEEHIEELELEAGVAPVEPRRRQYVPA